jgi:hypothetical protein
VVLLTRGRVQFTGRPHEFHTLAAVPAQENLR